MEDCEDPDYTGSAFISEDGFRLIVANSLQRPDRRAFTIAHELGHLILEHEPPRTYLHERLANVYASELLMPEIRIHRQVEEYGPDLLLLSDLAGVSLTAMRYRFGELGIECQALAKWG